jgi:hypothetical protein
MNFVIAIFHFRRTMICLSTLILLCASSASVALSPEHEADRLLIAVGDAFDQNQIKQAEQHLTAARKLGVALPADYLFFNGKLLALQNRNVEARLSLENYVEQTGKDARYYRDALGLLTSLQNNNQQSKSKAAATTFTANDSLQVEMTEDLGKYVGHLQQLYDIDDAAQALTRHINSLLRFYAYNDDRIIASSRLGTPSRHQLVANNNSEIVSMNKIGAGDKVPFLENRFSVYGINPYVNYQCFDNTASCWFYHPITAERWIQIVNNRGAAEEVSRALSQLIKDLQKRG